MVQPRFIRRSRALAMTAWVAATSMPAACMASILPWSVTLPPLTIAPAWGKRVAVRVTKHRKLLERRLKSPGRTFNESDDDDTDEDLPESEDSA